MMRVFLIVCTTLLLTLFHSVNSSWWSLSQFDKNSIRDPRILCDVVPNMHKKQRQICLKYSDFILHIGEGARHAIRECQYQFKFNKWNCSTFDRDSSVFGKFLLKGGTRELAFLQALTTASVAYTLAKACSSGSLRCPCTLRITDVYHKQSEDYKWKGCTDYIKFSVDFVRRFVDASETNLRDAKAKITLHNNRAGRITVRKLSEASKRCKCHGLSGSCTMRSCWSPLPSFRSVGDELREKYDQAMLIQFNPTGRMIFVDKYQKRPSKYNLIYLENSPDFCFTDHSKDLLGTANRLCTENSEGEDSCDILCCGRGHDSIRLSVTYRCQCSFIWCCEVKCNVCQGWQIESHCKPPRNHRLSKPNITFKKKSIRAYNRANMNTHKTKAHLRKSARSTFSMLRRSVQYGNYLSETENLFLNNSYYQMLQDQDFVNVQV